MISFVTLFLGLIFGPQPIELAVGEEVASVEIVIDGTVVARLDGAPWVVEHDFGRAVVPHHLVAIGLDQEGREVGRASQHLNLPRRPVEVTIVVRGDPEGKSSIADISWESRSGAKPLAVQAELDGASVAVEELSEILLPPHDPLELHFLQVAVEFDDGTRTTSELAFGGAHLDTVSSQLTAIPVELHGRGKLPKPEKLTGWFAAGAASPRVLSTETGSAEILVVRSRLSVGDLRWAQKQEMSKALPDAHWRRSRLFGSHDWRLRMIWPIARSETGNLTPFDLFPYSEPGPDETGSLVRWITETDPPKELRGHQRIADAVAVAGVTAAGTNRRRAVVVILGQHEADASAVEPEIASGYLRALRVPLFVWTTRPESESGRGWGTAQDVSTAAGLKQAVEGVLAALERQRVVWLAGDYRPQEVELTRQADGVRLTD